MSEEVPQPAPESSKDPVDSLPESELEPEGLADQELSTDSYEQLSEPVKAHYDRLAKRMFMFPSSLLRELNELIDTDTVTSAAKLRDVVKDRYKGTLKIPALTTFRAYVVLRKKQKLVLEKAKQALGENPQDLVKKAETVGNTSKSIYQDLTLSVENKKTLLESLIQLCEHRISAIRVLQETDPTSSYEAVLGSYIREVRAITETLIKLRNELKTEGEKEIELYIGSKLASVIRSTIQAYTAVHGPEKVELFRATLKLKLKDNKLEELSSANF